MTVIGELALWVALFLSLWGGSASFAGLALRCPELVASAMRATFATALMVALAAGGLWAALLRHDFSLEYVAAHTTLNTPTLYLLTAFWGGAAGAILSWALALSVCAAIATLDARRRGYAQLPLVVGVLAPVLALALGLLCFALNPYDRVDWVPAEGRGLHPSLQNPLAAPHFLAIYAAYAAVTVALALAVGPAVSGRAPAPIGATGVEGLGAAYPRQRVGRRWSLLAWLLLTVGIALRIRWAYVEPALDDLWSWEPAQAANVVLWLLGAAVARSLTAGDRTGRVGMYVVYAGLALLIAGVAGRRFWTDRSIRLRPGEATELVDPYGRRWRAVSQGASRDERMNYLSTGVALEAWLEGDHEGIVSAERRQYLDSVQRPLFEPAVKPGIRSSVLLDVYVILSEVREELAALRIEFRPLVALLWVGSLTVLAGVLVAAAG
jgi:cytochrome c biogenesis factor